MSSLFNNKSSFKSLLLSDTRAQALPLAFANLVVFLVVLGFFPAVETLVGGGRPVFVNLVARLNSLLTAGAKVKGSLGASVKDLDRVVIAGDSIVA